MARELYLGEKYRVTLGRGRIGFCTVWSDPEIILAQAPGLLDHAAIVGTLYSREGVNVMLRNLALNPDIRHLVIWGQAPLSKTPFGLAGKSIIDALWSDGVHADGKVVGANFPLHAEFDLAVIDAIRKNVALVDVSEKTLPEALDVATNLASREPYMKPAAFPEHKLEAGQPFPSERVGFTLRGHGIIEAWTRAIDRVVRYGVVKETEYGNKQRELIGVTWVITHETTDNAALPDWPEELLKVTGASRDAIERYYPEFMSAELPAGTAYTYGQRLWAYDAAQGSLSGSRDIPAQPVSQIKKVIEHLKESAVTRRAVATTWNQYLDADTATKNPPCLVMMQMLQTDGQLHMLATFRSHDMFKAAIPNAFGLRRLHEHIAHETGFELGELAITSNSAHIYEEDWDNARKLVQCAIWEQPARLTFDQNLDTDPRGLVIIRLDQNGEIVADVASPDGTTLLSLSGKTAKHVYKKLASLDLLSRPDHLMDIGAELQKAEIAFELGIPYIQDRPLNIPRPSTK